MKRHLSLIIFGCIAILTGIVILSSTIVKENSAVILYVAPNGNDNNMGTKKSPLATLEGARNKIRSLKAASGLPDKGITVYFRDGTYPVTTTTELNEKDSGTDNAPITYKAYPGEKPVFSGGNYIKGSDFRKVIDQNILSRLPKGTKEKILCYNLFNNGFTIGDLDYDKDFWINGNLQQFDDGDYFECLPRRIQVFIDDQALYLARYPNKKPGIFTDNPYDDYLSIPEVLVGKGIGPGWQETEWGNGGLPKFITKEDRIRNWKKPEDVVVFGMLGYEWSHNKIVAEKIDTQAMTVELKTQPIYGPSLGARYAFENVLEELDTPSEYYIDKHTGMLYLYPAKNMDNTTVKVSKLDVNFMIDCTNVSYVVFSGLTFELTKGSIIRVKGGESCTIEGCTMKNFGVMGARIGEWANSSGNIGAEYDQLGLDFFLTEHPASENGYRHRVTGCQFLNTGFAACGIQTGNVANRERGDISFDNNIIKHSGLFGSTYFSGLILGGVGISVRNNEFYHCRGQAIMGNIIDTEIIYNEFCDSPCDMAEDTGTIYINFLCLNDGVSIRYNYFHDVTNEDARRSDVWGGAPVKRAARGAGCYDSDAPFKDFSYNVVYNYPSTCGFSIIAPFTAINNVFIDCHNPMQDYKGALYVYQSANISPLDVLTGTNPLISESTIVPFYTKGIYKTPHWKKKYPELCAYINYMANEKKDIIQPMDQIYNNLFININTPLDDWGGGDLDALNLPGHIPVDPKYGKIENNIYLTSDPGFANYTKKNFQLSQKVANQYGIERIDMNLIGVKVSATK